MTRACRPRRLGASLALLGLGTCACAWLGGGAGRLEVPGELGFPVSCDPARQQDFDGAVAALHSFEYQEARARFAAVAERDPGCAMAFWGLAMTEYHPLWEPPTRRELRRGRAALATARSLPASDRERLWIEALGAFYDGADEVGHRERAVRHEEGMAHLHRQHPDDREAQVFYALALLANADPADASYAVPRQSGALLEPLFAEMPRHPGVVHYLIQSYDHPPLAGRALAAAQRYLELADSMPHALHVSGHIFTRLGLWEEAIEANARSAEAARARGRRLGAGTEALRSEVHALDYLVYAQLQRGEDEEAARIAADLESRAGIEWRNGAVAWNAGAIPVRCAVERRDWRQAAVLPALRRAERAGSESGTRAAVVLRTWARALGAARGGDVARGEIEVADLERLAGDVRDSQDAWLRNTSEGLRLQATAWLAQAQGDPVHALDLMRSAAALEDETAEGIGPGRVLPAREQLGDLLLLQGRPGEALAEYRASLERAARRYRSLLGAARAALAAGEPRVARAYYEELLELAPASRRAENDEARQLAAALQAPGARSEPQASGVQ